MQWQGAADDPNGIGVGHYLIYRNSQFYQETTTAEFTDEAVSPSTTYTYGIVARDYHLNDSTQTAFSVTTPPATAVEPRRVGVRPTGSYWGAGGEQIDTLSGNLNFTLPLFKAMGRGGWGAGFSLNYNSQLWRKDPAATWKLGRDVGYGFGWRLQAGSLTPYWEDPWTIHHYTFIDSTGAEYRLDVPDANGETWTSKEGIYLTYDRVANRLYFRDGSFWVMGCSSAGTEQDAGTRYPTVMQDSNGNQVLIRYLAGVGLAWDNTSARISVVEDVRATDGGSGYRSYSFTFNSDTVPHLTKIQFQMGLSTHYHFYYADQSLNSPFSPPVAFGTTRVLTSVRLDDVALTHQFEYDSGGAGELAKLTLPYGGYLRWAYQDAAYSGSRTFRSVQNRYLAKSAGANETTYAFTPGTPGDTVRPYTYLDDPSGNGRKAWFFTTSGSAWQIGLQSSYEEQPGPGQTAKRKQEYTWTTDSAGNPYVASVLTTLDQGTAYVKQSKTEQTLDVHGNATQTKIYGYDSLTTPVRTYTNTYLGGSNYTSRYIYNRLATSSLSGGGQQMTLVSNSYDSGLLADIEGLREHDTANYGAGFTYRGNVTQRVAGGVTTNFSYDITGTVYSANDGQGHSVSIDPAEGTNHAAPGVITPNSQSNLAESFTYSSFLAVTTDTGPNSSTATTAYDSSARPTSSTSPFGATTTYTYTNSPPTTTATTNGRWTKTTMDGLGRTIKVETGYGSTTVSIMDTEYDSCACSPLGKVKRVSQPYAPGGTVYWTTYSYDCLGRTVSVAQPDNTGTVTYVYQGNTVTLTDSAGKWKKYTLDALGNLVQVTEPNPGGGEVQTYYTYNLRNQLTQVSMPRGGTTQTRTFNYDLTTGRLSSAANPENGTVSYAYNTDGSLASKTDAKNQQVQYSYDELGRATQIRRYPVAGGNEDPCQRTDLYYDTNPLDGSYTQNGWGRPVAAAWGGQSCTGGEFKEMYSYTEGGLATKKKLVRNAGSLEAGYAYDDEGKMLSVSYPATFGGYDENGQPIMNPGPVFTYTYDSMARPIKLTDDQTTPVDWAKEVLYNAAGQMTQVKQFNPSSGTWRTETRQYNVLQQMTRLTVASSSTSLDYEYRFSDTQNNGRITQRKEWVSGEEVSYQYDSLNRLISAATTGPEWGQSFGYDGFGNLLSQTVTKGTAPTLSVNVNPATNRITTGGYGYDANGNLTSMPMLTMSYDVENRLVEATDSTNGTDQYVYDPAGRRVWKQQPDSYNYVSFYSVDGTVLGTYFHAGDGFVYGDAGFNVHFAGKLLAMRMYSWNGGVAVHEDRLGSVARRGSTNRKYFPYGEEPTTTAQNETKFATYFRDQTTALDYAQNRYYARTIGRFTSTDPSEPGDPSDPQSWNYYAYVGNEPVNSNDPEGLGCLGLSFCASVNPTPQTVTLQLPFGFSIIGPPPSWVQGYYVSFQSFGGTPRIAPRTSPQSNSWDRYRDIIYQVDTDLNFRPQILDCMAGIESRWNPTGTNGSHKGLYQMNEQAWRDSKIPLSYSHVTNAADSTAAVLGELYYKMIIRAFGGSTAQFQAAWKSNGGIFSSQQINLALQGHRGSNFSEVNNMYASTIQICAYYMTIGQATRAYDWIYWYGTWENNFNKTHK